MKGDNQPRQLLSYKDLTVWQKSRELVKAIYLLLSKFPSSEKYGLVDQIKRASVSIVANIAEGKQRQTKKEYVQFLFIAYGSSAEVEALLTLAIDLEFATEKELIPIFNELTQIQKMLNVMIYKLK